MEREAEKNGREVERLRSEIETIINRFSVAKRINDVCSLSAVKIEPSNRPDQDFAYIGLEHIESNTGDLTEIVKVKGSALKSTKNRFEKGSVLYGKLRPYLNKVYLTEFDGVCSTDILVLRPRNGIILKHILLGKAFIDKTTSLMKGLSLPRIGVKDFMSLTVKYPEERQQAGVATELLNHERRIAELKSQISEAKAKKASIPDKYLK